MPPTVQHYPLSSEPSLQVDLDGHLWNLTDPSTPGTPTLHRIDPFGLTGQPTTLDPFDALRSEPDPAARRTLAHWIALRLHPRTDSRLDALAQRALVGLVLRHADEPVHALRETLATPIENNAQPPFDVEWPRLTGRERAALVSILQSDTAFLDSPRLRIPPLETRTWFATPARPEHIAVILPRTHLDPFRPWISVASAALQ